jgi:hypothetical protein
VYRLDYSDKVAAGWLAVFQCGRSRKVRGEKFRKMALFDKSHLYRFDREVWKPIVRCAAGISGTGPDRWSANASANYWCQVSKHLASSDRHRLLIFSPTGFGPVAFAFVLAYAQCKARTAPSRWI